MQNLIKEIINKEISFEGAATLEKFYAIFVSLYNIPLYKTGLDLVLTKMQEGELHFEVKIIKDWDTNVGCYLTEQNKIFNKVLNRFSDKFRHKIIIKNLLVNVVAHEMAHALEVESGLKLDEKFRTCIGYDMKDRRPKNLAFSSEIDRLMIEQVKPYPDTQVISELFARYFELLSISRDVNKNGAFLTSEVMNFFANTTKYVKEVFNKKIESKIDPVISKQTVELIRTSSLNDHNKFVHNVEGFHKKTDEKGRKSFAANVKSNASWQKSWEQHQGKIENPRTKNIEEDK